MNHTFPVLRWVAAAWLLVWIPVYWRFWGWRNFLQMCDICIGITCAGLWWGNALLLSASAVGSLGFDLLWCLDVAGRLISGRHVVHGTEYMWNRNYPLWVRLLSLYHVALPVVLLYSLRWVGYDPRGWLLQVVITAPVLVLARLLAPGQNVNFVERDPFANRAVGPAPVHVMAAWLVATFLVYWPIHRLLAAVL